MNTLPVSGSILSSSRHVVILSMYNTLVMLSNEMLVTEFAYTVCTNMVLRCNVINDSLYCASFQQNVKKNFWELKKWNLLICVVDRVLHYLTPYVDVLIRRIELYITHIADIKEVLIELVN